MRKRVVLNDQGVYVDCIMLRSNAGFFGGTHYRYSLVIISLRNDISFTVIRVNQIEYGNKRTSQHTDCPGNHDTDSLFVHTDRPPESFRLHAASYVGRGFGERKNAVRVDNKMIQQPDVDGVERVDYNLRCFDIFPRRSDAASRMIMGNNGINGICGKQYMNDFPYIDRRTVHSAFGNKIIPEHFLALVKANQEKMFDRFAYKALRNKLSDFIYSANFISHVMIDLNPSGNLRNHGKQNGAVLADAFYV